MRKINFTKMVAAGNDFVLAESGNSGLAKKICDRKYGVGADGLLVLEKSKVADVKMRIFNADGSQAEMCGNGARCAAVYANKKIVHIETKAGVIESRVSKDNVKIRLTDPKHTKLDIAIAINKRKIKVNFLDTGVPHAVIFVQGLEKINVENLGRSIRHHQAFSPRGTNVNFVEVLNRNSIAVRTYERGVEDETLACGTGSVASALIFALKTNTEDKILVHTRGGEVLAVYFRKKGKTFSDVWLEGKVKTVHKGVICI